MCRRQVGSNVIAAITATLVFIPAITEAQGRRDRYNGFDVSNALIPKKEIKKGGPPRDGIPAILKPKFIGAADADYLRDGDLVVGVEGDGEAKAYPLRILVWHEIANDTVGRDDVVITYCPLCGTCMTFDRTIDGKEFSFGVSGLLYNSDVLMYDHQTESLWSQLKMQAVAGPMVGTELSWEPSSQMTWKAWRTKHPDTKVLSTDTGFVRNYNKQPYAGYEDRERLFFPVPQHRDELKNKAWVVGVIVNGAPKAYPVRELEKSGDGPVRDIVGGKRVEIAYDADAQYAEVRERDTGEIIPNVRAYWFAWQAFYPATKLYGDN